MALRHAPVVAQERAQLADAGGWRQRGDQSPRHAHGQLHRGPEAARQPARRPIRIRHRGRARTGRPRIPAHSVPVAAEGGRKPVRQGRLRTRRDQAQSEEIGEPPMSSRFRNFATGLAAAAVLSMAAASASAHRAWILPSATNVSGTDMWVTVDAAISNNLFNADHAAMQLGAIKVAAPDGSEVAPQNGATGRYRTTLDVKLDAPGTYKIFNHGHNIMATFTENGERRRVRGPVERLKDVPANAADLKVTEIISRNETFVSYGNLTTDVFKPTGLGLELEP